MYLDEGYEEVQIGTVPQCTQVLTNNIQAKQKQYGLKHRVTSTIHAAMGDTLPSIATKISRTNGNFKMWDKGDKNEALAALKDLLTRKMQWTDYMEEVLHLITKNIFW
eukprot:11187120-Ditylum_brightwellii.AAC.1